MPGILRIGIAGVGEVGGAFRELLEGFDSYEIRLYDPFKGFESDLSRCDVVHVCVPSDKVIDIVQKFGREPTYLIHSTVAIGTCEQARNGTNWVFHSPIRGRHPLIREMQSFKLLISAEDHNDLKSARVKQLKEYLNNIGFETEFVSGYAITEIAKLYCTTRLGWEILFMREVYETCKKYNVPFDKVYKEWTQDYNGGFDSLSINSNSKFHRTILEPLPGKIGGHCVMGNAELLAPHSDIAKKVLEEGKKDWLNE